MITFKEFMIEANISTLHKKMHDITDEVAEQLALPRYYVHAAMRKETKDRPFNSRPFIFISVQVPNEYLDGKDFFKTMSTAAVKKALAGQFNEFSIDSVSVNDPIDSGDKTFVTITASVLFPTD